MFSYLLKKLKAFKIDHIKSYLQYIIHENWALIIFNLIPFNYVLYH
jgi:hypothetical protein